MTSPAIRKFLEAENQPQSLAIMVQKEVAQRMCAKPPKMNILAVSVQFYATPKIISYVKKTSFWPQPKVDSAIIQITPHKEPAAVDPKKFFQVVKAGFKQPRKQLKNNLPGAVLHKIQIDSTRRAETLSIKDWIDLAGVV
jgi:16S rRNA (adenine1518-N6/adenine1519-N6)-dimethyltransferase